MVLLTARSKKEGKAHFSGDHCRRKIPRGDEGGRTYRLFHGQEPSTGKWGLQKISPNSSGFLRIQLHK